MPLTLKPHNVILFQGDSITDAGRTRSRIGPNSPDGMGFGYARFIADYLLKENPGNFHQFYNRAVSGDQIHNLASRWEQDTLRLMPDVISILIGVNDTWNHAELGLGSDPETFQGIYRKILSNTREKLPDIQLVLCEPFLLLVADVDQAWIADLNLRQDIIRGLAEEFQGIFVPFQAALNHSAREVPPRHLLEDGVHPTRKGHDVLYENWLSSVFRQY
ncbi:MAG: SGNH/GDSL hydrolase family protein [Anaerolineales bacterium]